MAIQFVSINPINFSYHHNHQLLVFIPHDHYPAFHAKNNLNYLLLKRIAKGGDQNNQQHEKEGRISFQLGKLSGLQRNHTAHNIIN